MNIWANIKVFSNKTLDFKTDSCLKWNSEQDKCLIVSVFNLKSVLDLQDFDYVYKLIINKHVLKILKL